MSCCGERRAAAAAPPQPANTIRPAQRVSSAAVYQYLGATGLTVIGPVTGLRYRFDAPGSKVQIDWRDVPSFAGLPNLRRVQ